MADAGTATVLEAVGIVRRYPVRGRSWLRAGGEVAAVSGVSLALAAGEIYGLVGGSGAGKSTLARVLAGLEEPDSGVVRYGGTALGGVRGESLRRLRKLVQIVFQDPAASLNPRHRVGTIVAEPLVVHSLAPAREWEERVLALLAAVGLPATRELLGSWPHQLSGGERQRVAIARALACEPRALILDEPVSALDVSVRGQVLNVLLRLRDERGLALLLIAHDLRLVAWMSDHVGVMAGGRIVDEGTCTEVMQQGRCRETSLLVAAARLDGRS